MPFPLKSLLVLVLSLSLRAGEVPGASTPRRESFGFPGSNVDVCFTNPDPSVWEPLDLGNAPRPDMRSRSFRHKGIRDAKGVVIHPVLSITAWKFPDDRMTLKDFSDYLLERTQLQGTTRVLADGRLHVRGTVDYGGTTHVIRRALSFWNRVGIDLVCDSTLGVHPQVQEAFEAWCRTAALVPRIVPAPVQLPGQPAQEPGDGVVAPSTRQMDKQKPGQSTAGDVAAIQDEGAMVILWNRSTPYFQMRVEGNAFAGYGDERALFSVDGVPLQIHCADPAEFRPGPQGKDPASILVAHRDWEFRYLQDATGEKHALRSWMGRLENGSPVLYWDATPEKPSAGGVKRHIFCARYQSGSVIAAASAETGEINEEQARSLVFQAISSMTFSDQAFDIQKIQRELADKQP